MSQGANEIGRFYACTILGTLDLEYLTFSSKIIAYAANNRLHRQNINSENVYF